MARNVSTAANTRLQHRARSVGQARRTRHSRSITTQLAVAERSVGSAKVKRVPEVGPRAACLLAGCCLPVGGLT